MTLWYDFGVLPVVTKTYGELMDEVFLMWVADGTGKTLEEFMA